MNQCDTSVAPGPGCVRVTDWLLEKMLLKGAPGLENCGAPAGNVAWNSGSFASDARPAECGVASQVSHDAVATLFATVLLTIVTFDESSIMMPPPRSAEPLSTTMLLRMLTRAFWAFSRKIPPPSSPE